MAYSFTEKKRIRKDFGEKLSILDRAMPRWSTSATGSVNPFSTSRNASFAG